MVGVWLGLRLRAMEGVSVLFWTPILCGVGPGPVLWGIFHYPLIIFNAGMSGRVFKKSVRY